MTALVIESQPLIRLGMQRMMERIPGVGPVRALEPAAIVSLERSAELVPVVYGMSDDSADNWYLLRRLHQALPNARILLLTDNMWARVPAAPDACGVVEQLPKTASIERIEASVLQMMGCEGFVPLQAGVVNGWRPVYLSPRAMS
ncbi:response regulator [Cupriavidus agavae]|uniref:Response regulatory domain-containing protein n=1 Tax=Cupriavidus agavae TaxID=1001822 RepID=A0A4Q7S8H1_9BURK|nr:response regulator transcription factor [Cupriavidus agavae]RZT42746.1 hypothetical protein EV147_1787 [Cupriavidus agavae]